VILEKREKESSNLEFKWGRKTVYKIYPKIKNRNCTFYELRWTSVFSLFNLWLELVTSFSASY
jgi:hypothetical protein